MKITILGSGDAIGTPKVGCTCPQCTHAHREKIMRLRTSLLIENQGFNLLIDSTPDLRQQLILNGSPKIDAVIWTHGHYDHFIGFGEFYRIQKIPPVYAPQSILTYCADYFRYLSFREEPVTPYTKREICGVILTFFEVTHPPTYTCGILIENANIRVAYTSDTNREIPEKSLDLLTDLDLLFIDTLTPHNLTTTKHMSSDEAESLARQLDPKDYRSVHQSHHIPWDLPHQGRDSEIFEFR